MFTETSRQGAAATRRTAPKNIMEVLVAIIEANPTANNDELFRKWSDIVKDDDDLLDAALLHTFTNLIASLKRPHRGGQSRFKGRSREERDASVAQIKREAKEILILDLIMPNGKPLRVCTGAYGRQCGGGIGRVAKAVKPMQIIGQVLNDEQAQRLWRGK